MKWLVKSCVCSGRRRRPRDILDESDVAERIMSITHLAMLTLANEVASHLSDSGFIRTGCQCHVRFNRIKATFFSTMEQGVCVSSTDKSQDGLSTSRFSGGYGTRQAGLFGMRCATRASPVMVTVAIVLQIY